MKPPCYNEQTKTDCPNRKPGCGATCDKWQEYTVEREKVYEARRKKNQAASGHYASVQKRAAKKEKERMRTKGVKYYINR